MQTQYTPLIHTEFSQLSRDTLSATETAWATLVLTCLTACTRLSKYAYEAPASKVLGQLKASEILTFVFHKRAVPVVSHRFDRILALTRSVGLRCRRLIGSRLCAPFPVTMAEIRLN
jgi:hypothetical protein